MRACGQAASPMSASSAGSSTFRRNSPPMSSSTLCEAGQEFGLTLGRHAHHEQLPHGEGLPPLGPRHVGRGHAARGGLGLRGRLGQEGRLHRQGGAARKRKRGANVPAASAWSASRSRIVRRRGADDLSRGADLSRWRDRRFDDVGRLGPSRRAVAGLGLRPLPGRRDARTGSPAVAGKWSSPGSAMRRRCSCRRSTIRKASASRREGKEDPPFLPSEGSRKETGE